MVPRRLAAMAAIVLLASGCGATGTVSSPAPSATSPASASAPPNPATASQAPTPEPSASALASPAASGAIDPADFVATVDNPWFPLIPGTIFTNAGVKDGKKAVDTFEVTGETAMLAGVTCVVIHDSLTLDGLLEERTTDYYTQDRAGNVWYFGEDTAELDAKGNVTSTEGSWHAGVDGATPGIYMPATPIVGQAFPQEFYKGHAEDHFRVKALGVSVKVPFGSYTDALLTEEWTPLEPDVLDNKYYVHGIGQVREVAVKGDPEETVLTKLQRP